MGPPAGEPRVGLASVVVDGVHSHDVGQLLDVAGVVDARTMREVDGWLRDFLALLGWLAWRSFGREEVIFRN